MKFQKQTQDNSSEYQDLVADLKSDLIFLGDEIQSKSETENLKERILLASKNLDQQIESHDMTAAHNQHEVGRVFGLVANLASVFSAQKSVGFIAVALVVGAVFFGTDNYRPYTESVSPAFLEEADLTFHELFLTEDEVLFASAN